MMPSVLEVMADRVGFDSASGGMVHQPYPTNGRGTEYGEHDDSLVTETTLIVGQKILVPTLSIIST